jgi:aminoglycoside phosphotransferase family enzyme/predicted kinase
VYLDVLPITAGRGGRLLLGGRGEAVDYVVHMRRLPADRLLVELLRRDAVTGEMIDALARRLVAFHASAPTGPAIAAHAAPERLRARWEENLRDAAAFAGRLLAAEDHECLADFGPHFVATHETLLEARQRGGHVREGHGDLHAEHVCFVEAAVAAPGEPPPLAAGIYVFDCIEFSEPLRCNDVAYEIAFLAMDLASLEREDLARRLVAAYAAAAEDPAVELLLPFYACHLACVRGKVEGLESAEPEVEAADRERAAARARRHFALAVRYAWSAGGSAVVACAGLSGSGKTTLAEELAATTGFRLLSTDALRKRARGGEPPAVAPYDAGLYTPAARAAVYEALAADADAALAAGRGVIADATFLRHADRHRLAEVARRRRSPCMFVECRADEAVIRSRLEARTQAPAPLSDARWETYLAQRERAEPLGADEPHVVVDTSAGLGPARAAAVRGLWPWRQGRPIG